MIKKSYRGYGTIFSDKFTETFLRDDSRNVSRKFFIIFGKFSNSIFRSQTDMDLVRSHPDNNNHLHEYLLVAQEQNSQ
jgi:hypothetical protein